jgi:hypothetical protein
MRPGIWLRRSSLLAMLWAWSAGCNGSEGSGTFVKLSFVGTVSPDKPIQSIEVNAQLGTRTATTVFQAPKQGSISLPSDGILDIQSGEGALVVSARALAGDGTVLGTGDGQGSVTRGKTSSVTVTFSPPVVNLDAGIDSAVGTDALSQGEVAAIDTKAIDAAADTPVNIVPDAPPVTDGAGGAGGSDGRGTGGAGGVDGTVSRDVPITDSPGLGGAGGTGTGGNTGGAGTGGGSGGSITDGGTGGAGTGGTTGGYLLSVNPPSIDFGVILPGNASPPQSFTITNKGDAPTPALSPLFVSDPKNFPVYKDGCVGIPLSPGGTCTVAFTFNPSAPGVMRADGGVAPAGGTGAKFQLSGTGAGGPATLSLSPPTANLGLVNINTTALVNFTLTNGGDTDAGSIAIQVPGTPVFQLTANGCAGTLGPRSQCAFTVTFAPTKFGPASTTITAQSSLGLSASASMSGTGRDSVTLTIAFTGTGGGTVTGGPQSCASSAMCVFNIPLTDPAAIPQFVLAATPDDTSVFDGWSGDCSGTACTVVMSQAHSVTAQFTRKVTLNLTVLGLAGHTGALTSPDGSIIYCSSGSCSLLLPPSAGFTLNARPASGSTFAGWTSGPVPCKGTSPQCTFALTSTVSITATFGPQSYMFVTSLAVKPGTLGSIQGADDFCTTLAQKAIPSLPGKYYAWLSSSTGGPANGRVGPGGWIRTDGRPFAGDLKSLTDPSYLTVYYPPRLDENGNDLGNKRIPVATGSGPNGSGVGTWCKEYQVIDGALYAGDASSGSAAWSSVGPDPSGCGNDQHLYCFRADLNVTTVLTPPTQPGRRVFTTARPFVIGDWKNPDELCWNEADKNFLAFIAFSGASAMSRVSLTGTPWKRTDGVFIVEQPADLGNMQLLAPIDGTADGKTYTTANVWTGAKEPRAKGINTCGDWSGNSTATTGIVGDSETSASPDWFSPPASTTIGTPCTDTVTHLMCIEP